MYMHTYLYMEQCGVDVDDKSRAIEHKYAICEAYLFRAYASDGKGMYIGASYHIVDCSKLKFGIYADIVV